MKLYYFTASYPFGLGELWKSNELNILIGHFEEIIVIPYSYEGNFYAPKELPPGVKILGPLFEDASFSYNIIGGLIRVIFSRFRGKFWKEFVKKKVYRSRAIFTSWLYASLNVIRLMDNLIVKEIISSLDKSTVLYFFWGKGSAEFLPFIDTSRCLTSFVRMHRYDLFESVNDNYIPYRRPLLENVDTIAPSSEAGKIHLQELYPDLKSKIKLFRLGTVGNGKKCRASVDNVFRIVSCSYLSPVKRVSIMIESLQYLDFPVLWRHVGDGKERIEMDQLIEKYGLKNKFIIEGMIDSRELLDFYTSNTFDLFVNVSASEGVPMSIMEAFSVAIPVMGTCVGGIGEIVDDTVGKILPPDITPLGLAGELEKYYYLPPSIKEKKREMAYKKSKDQCDAVTLAGELVVALKSFAS